MAETKDKRRAVQLAFQVDWNNKQSCKTHVLQVKFVPQNYPAEPTNVLAPWQFGFNVYSCEKIPAIVKKKEEIVHQKARALLWQEKAPFGKYKHCMTANVNKFDERLYPYNIVFRVDPNETNDNALIWVRKSNAYRRRRDQSYLKLVDNHTYHLNITFVDGVLLEQCITAGWKFVVNILSVGRKREQMVFKHLKNLTTFVVHWLNSVEADADANEWKMTVNALELDEKETAIEDAEAERVAKAEEDRINAENKNSGNDVNTALNALTSATTPSGRPSSMIYNLNGLPDSPNKRVQEIAKDPINNLPADVTMKVDTQHTGGCVSNESHARNVLRQNTKIRKVDELSTDSMPIDRPPKKYHKDWDLNDVTHTVFAEPPTVDVTKTTPDEMAPLPDLKDFDTTDVSFVPQVEKFLEPSKSNITLEQKLEEQDSNGAPVTSVSQEEPSSISDYNIGIFFCKVCSALRHISEDATQTKTRRDGSKRVVDFLSANAQLFGWQHVAEFMLDPLRYVEKTKAYPRTREGESMSGDSANKQPQYRPFRSSGGEITTLQHTGQCLLKDLWQRIHWLLKVEQRSQIPAGTKYDRVDIAIRVLQHDIKWLESAAKFMKDAELSVTTMIANNPGKFAQFRELQSKGVSWPHSPQLRRDIEAAGFIFRPMMIKRDRCVCDTCGVEVSGWRAWHDPWSFHDASRHPGGLRRT
jgi:hypothetical protein